MAKSKSKDLLQETIARIGEPDLEAITKARQRQDSLTKPPGSLGRLEEVSVQLAGIRGYPIPPIKKKVIIVAAADHGVTAEGVSAYPSAVTGQMVRNFLAGGAAINVLARHAGAQVVVVDAGVNAELEGLTQLISKKAGWGTANMAKGPAMTREQAVACLEAGIEAAQQAVKDGADLLGTGDMGIGNTTASSAITAAVTREPVWSVTGRGTGITETQRQHKAHVIQKALDLNKPDSQDGLDVLSKVGGFEIGVLAGVMLGGAANRRPVVIDGFISGAAALIARRLAPKVKPFLFASHQSAESGHETVHRYLGLEPLLDFSMRLGEGTGAALAMHVIEAAAKVMAEMATFESAGVSNKENPS